jgi:hypothetical protein
VHLASQQAKQFIRIFFGAEVSDLLGYLLSTAVQSSV